MSVLTFDRGYLSYHNRSGEPLNSWLQIRDQET